MSPAPAPSMRAFVLAAGLGTRLRPLTSLVPKPMVAVGDMPLVERAVRQLVAAGFHDIGINVYHQPDPILAHLGDGSRFGASIRYFDERESLPGEPAGRRQPLGTGGGLKAAQTWLEAGGDRFLLVNGDAWHSFDLGAVVAAHRPSALATMVVHVDRRRPELHSLSCSSDGSMRRFVARVPMSVDELEAHEDGFLGIYTGVAVLSTRLFERLPSGRVSGLVLHGLGPALADGETIRWLQPDGLWIDCGTIDELQRADIFARSLRVLPSEAALHARS
jgi:NDP-sugar pyrophosphorylase family protein